jgi:hypothetical protein
LRFETYARRFDIAFQYTNYLRERVDWETLNTEDAVEQMGKLGVSGFIRLKVFF